MPGLRLVIWSSAFAGTHSIDAYRRRTDKDGITYEAALKEYGVMVDLIGETGREQVGAKAYLDVHIQRVRCWSGWVAAGDSSGDEMHGAASHPCGVESEGQAHAGYRLLRSRRQ